MRDIYNKTKHNHVKKYDKIKSMSLTNTNNTSSSNSISNGHHVKQTLQVQYLQIIYQIHTLIIARYPLNHLKSCLRFFSYYSKDSRSQS